jgi:hypothetical protein
MSVERQLLPHIRCKVALRVGRGDTIWFTSVMARFVFPFREISYSLWRRSLQLLARLSVTIWLFSGQGMVFVMLTVRALYCYVHCYSIPLPPSSDNIHSSVICQTTGPQPLPKRFLHLMRSRAPSFKWEYPLLSPRSSSSCLRLLPRLLVTSSDNMDRKLYGGSKCLSLMTSAPSRLRNYQLHHYYKCDTFAAFLVLQPRLKNERERLSENKNSA